MSRDEFIKTACKLGYCNKKQAEKYCDKAKKDKYTDDDYIEVYRIAEVEHYRSTGDRVLGNGASTTKRYFRDGGNEGNR